MTFRVTYTGGDAPQRFLFDPDEVDVEEAERIESAIHAEWGSFLEGILNPPARVRRVLLWHLLRQANPGYNLAFEDAPKFKMGQLIIELGTVEIDRLMKIIVDSPKLTDARKSESLGPLLEERARAEAAEAELAGDEVTTDPKEPEPLQQVAVVASGFHVTEGLPEEPAPEDSAPPEMPTSPSSPTT